MAHAPIQPRRFDTVEELIKVFLMTEGRRLARPVSQEATRELEATTLTLLAGGERPWTYAVGNASEFLAVGVPYGRALARAPLVSERPGLIPGTFATPYPSKNQLTEIDLTTRALLDELKSPSLALTEIGRLASAGHGIYVKEMMQLVLYFVQHFTTC